MPDRDPVVPRSRRTRTGLRSRGVGCPRGVPPAAQADDTPGRSGVVTSGIERDDGLRAACFLALDALRARLGDELPYARGLDAGFVYDGERIPFLGTAKGIHRAARQRGRAALS